MPVVRGQAPGAALRSLPFRWWLLRSGGEGCCPDELVLSACDLGVMITWREGLCGRAAAPAVKAARVLPPQPCFQCGSPVGRPAGSQRWSGTGGEVAARGEQLAGCRHAEITGMPLQCLDSARFLMLPFSLF